MDYANPALGILIVSHGSPLEGANQGFEAMVARLANRLQGVLVLPAFSAIGHPTIPEQVALMASRGVKRVLLMPHFLFSGRHVLSDIPALVDQCRRRFPSLAMELLPALGSDPALEDLLVERILALAQAEQPPALDLPD